jgi:hypothetical protein
MGAAQVLTIPKSVNHSAGKIVFAGVEEHTIGQKERNDEEHLDFVFVAGAVMLWRNQECDPD